MSFRSVEVLCLIPVLGFHVRHVDCRVVMVPSSGHFAQRFPSPTSHDPFNLVALPSTAFFLSLADFFHALRRVASISAHYLTFSFTFLFKCVCFSLLFWVASMYPCGPPIVCTPSGFEQCFANFPLDRHLGSIGFSCIASVT